LHEELESALATFYWRAEALVFSTGYMAILGGNLRAGRPCDIVLFDLHSHASAIDAARLSGARMKFFRHNDPDSLSWRPSRGG
jgi:8-amino-7-oxononanoate synthase